MGEAVYGASDEAKQVFYIASEATGVDLAEVCFGSQTERLEETLVSQPAIAAVSIAEYYELKKLGFRPDAGIGHSMGEIPLLTMVGAISLRDTFDLLQVRATVTARASQERPGIMAAVSGLSLEDVKSRAATVLASGRAAIANLNHTGQHVFSGDTDVMEELEKIIENARISERLRVRFTKLKTGGAFHSRYHMESAVSEFREALKSIDFEQPEFELMMNNAQYLSEVGTHHLPEYLSQQLINGVDFTGGVSRLVGDGVSNFVEVGPNGPGGEPKRLGILSGLVKKDFEDVKIVEIQEFGPSARHPKPTS